MRSLQTSALFGAKTSDFSKFMVCPYGQEGAGLSQCGHFTNTEGEEVSFVFAILCGVFYGRSFMVLFETRIGAAIFKPVAIIAVCSFCN